MTLVVTVVCQDGVVVAADSHTTLANDRTLRVASDFTHKVFESGRVAVTTYGEALLLGRSIASHMAEFAVVEAQLRSSGLSRKFRGSGRRDATMTSARAH